MELRRYWAPQIAKDVYVLISHISSNAIIRHFTNQETWKLVAGYFNENSANSIKLSTIDGYIQIVVSSSREWVEKNAKHYNLEIPTEYYKEEK